MNDSTKRDDGGNQINRISTSLWPPQCAWPAAWIAVIGVGAATAALSGGAAPTSGSPAPPIASVAPAGEQAAQPPATEAQQIYLANCATCHGPGGQGDGPASYLLFPKPRDFTSGIYRFKSTFNDAPPTRTDLERSIRNGIARTAMPAFDSVLSDAQIASLIDYVLSLNTAPWPQGPVEPVTIPPKPEFTQDLIKQGHNVFVTMGCAPCHGETGRGDGPSAQGLIDSNGYPLPPADFTTGVFKAGRTSEDLYRTILVGVPGTPMPSFEAAMNAGIKVEGLDPSTDMVWAMVAYLESLIESREQSGVPSGAVIAPAATASTAMMADPFDSGWSAVEPVTASLQPLWQRRHATRSLAVRTAKTDDRIAFCVEWADSTVDGPETLDSATDAVGIMFSLTSEAPMLTMGQQDGQAQTLVNIWQWKASRQMDADANQRRDIALSEMGDPVDMYPFKSGDPVTGPLTEHDPTYITAWGAGNPQSDPALMNRPVLCMNAAGFGSTTIAPPDDQNVDGVGRWRDGAWRVVFVRELPAHHEGDVDFAAMQRVPIAFAAWDGAALDRNGTKLISGWHWLEMPR
ncbi:MAG: c-type cytochrome [Phycisphaerales bacterium]|nr:c-type cytochrome [Phycisphaerales bacterium]